MPSDALDPRLVDCDTHCYETRDAFTRYMPKELLDRAVTTVTVASGEEMILADRRIACFNSENGVGFDIANPPGSLREMLRQMASGNPEQAYKPEPVRVEYIEREPRLALLDTQGIDRCVLYPGGLAFAAESCIDDQAILYANLHSFNRWFDETWGFNYQDRIYATAVLSLRDLDAAVVEAEHVIGLGARVVVLPTGPAYGRSPGDPYFDPVWARLDEAGVVVAFHIMENWYNGHIAPAWGLDSAPSQWQMSAWQWANLHGERPVEDTLSALIFDNLFGRFSNLMVLCSEFGCEWVPHFVEHLDKCRGLGRNGPWIGGKLTERPSETFRRRVRVVPYAEDDIPFVVDRMGHAESLVMGSDFPHPEGLAQPAQFAELVGGLSNDDQRRVLAENALSLFARN